MYLVVYLRELSRISVTDGTDKAVLVRIYTQTLMRKLQPALDSDVARVICKGLPFTSAMSDLAQDDATTVMSELLEKESLHV